MNPVAVVAAVVSGIAAAMLWCLIGSLTGYDLPPFVALFVGGIVGYGAIAFDGYGLCMAFCCAAICLASVFGGKVGGVYLELKEARDELAEQLNSKRYDAMKIDAYRLCTLPSSEYYEEFMVENGYAGSEPTDEDLARFTVVEVPVLHRLYTGNIDFGIWRELYVEKYLDYKMSGHTVAGLARAEIDLFDLIFAALSVAVTFGMLTNAAVARNARVSRAGDNNYYSP